MEPTATLERRLELAAGQDRLRESGDGQFGGGAPDGDGEREFARTAVGRLLAELDDGERRSCALWFWTSLRSAAEDPVSARALHEVARMGLEWTQFEEDGGMLSVVLSKAFLLVDDASITDPSILRQLPARAS